MKLEVLLSVMNLDKKDLDKMNITSKCTVINQTNKNSHVKYKNFEIYSYIGKGLSNSRNYGLDRVTEDIILLCDDDVIYNKEYENIVIQEFEKLPKADIIIFNFDSTRSIRLNKRKKRLYLHNVLNYSSYRIAFKKRSIDDIRFNPLFGSGAKYSNGEEAIFLTECLRKKLKIYSSDKYLGSVTHNNSYWFNGYNEKYISDKGVIFTAISKRFRHILMLQYLFRHKEVLENIKFKEAYKIMKRGSNEYLKR